MTKAQEIYQRHTAKRGNRPLAFTLTTKAAREIILSLRASRRNTAEGNAYLQWIIERIEKQLPKELRTRRRK